MNSPDTAEDQPDGRELRARPVIVDYMESDDSDEELSMRGLEDDVAPRVQKRKRRTKGDTLSSTEAAIQVVQSLVAGQTPEVVTAMAHTLPSLAENTANAPLLANPNTPVDNATAGNPAEGGSQQAEEDAESAKDSKKKFWTLFEMVLSREVVDVESGKKKTELEKCEAAGANHTLLKKLHSDKSNNIQARVVCKSCKKPGFSQTILVSTKTFEDHVAARHSGSIEANKESTVPSCFRPKGEAVILSGKLLGLLVEWIIQDNQALSAVDCPYFEALMEGMNLAYRIPSRNTIKARILELMESTKVRMKAWFAEERSKGVFFSFTLDFWTSVNNKPYVAVTIHSVSSGWSFENFLLAFREVPHPHTAAEVASCIVEILREFGLLDCVVSFTSDNADNMVNGMANLIPMLFGKVAAVHLRCAAHCLNLIVQAGLAVAKGSIDAIRNFVIFVRRSIKQRQQLNAIARH